jgi:hypothetical protein
MTHGRAGVEALCCGAVPELKKGLIVANGKMTEFSETARCAEDGDGEVGGPLARDELTAVH